MTVRAAPPLGCGVYALADDDPSRRHGPREIVEAALAGGARVVQLRLKHTADRDALALARWAVERAHDAGVELVVNDRYDLADLAGADGVHLGDGDLAPERVPPDVRERLRVGLSTHTLEQVRASRTRPVDHVAFGPVFGTTSKETGWSARGVDRLAEAVKLAERPLVAIGGIDASNIARVRGAGARLAAVISAIADADDPEAATRELARAFERGHSSEHGL